MRVATIANLLEISPTTVKRYIDKFYRTGDVCCQQKKMVLLNYWEILNKQYYFEQYLTILGYTYTRYNQSY